MNFIIKYQNIFLSIIIILLELLIIRGLGKLIVNNTVLFGVSIIILVNLLTQIIVYILYFFSKNMLLQRILKITYIIANTWIFSIFLYLFALLILKPKIMCNPRVDLVDANLNVIASSCFVLVTNLIQPKSLHNLLSKKEVIVIVLTTLTFLILTKLVNILTSNF